jgi:hypothetical protein
MSIGSFIKRAVPIAFAAATGGPGAVFAKGVQLSQEQRAEKTQKRIINEQNALIAQENARMAEIFGTGNISSVQAPLGGSAVTRSGFGSGFGTFLTDVGRNIINPLSSVATSVLPFFGSRDQARQPATTRRPILQGTELQTTGQNEAFIGGFGSALGAAGRFLRTPAGQIGTGLGISGALGFAGMGAPTMRITRKTKRLAQQAYSLAMGDLGTALGLFTQLSGLSVNEQEFVLILTKRFRNDGPVVTKAALRKTKTTIRRLKNMCDMYDSLRKAPTRRRTPMKRAVGTTLISNK